MNFPKHILCKVFNLKLIEERIVMIRELDSTYQPKHFPEFEKKYKIQSLEEKDIEFVIAFCEKSYPEALPRIKEYIKRKFKAFLFYKDSTLIGFLWWHDKG
jgi:hypothetical protein